MNCRPSGRPTSESALREGIQRSLKGAEADTVCNMGPDASLDTIVKIFTIIYGNVKSYDILMGDFYKANQGEDETATSFATQIEGLLSHVRDKFPIKFLWPRNRISLRTDCFMAVRRVYGIL